MTTTTQATVSNVYWRQPIVGLWTVTIDGVTLEIEKSDKASFVSTWKARYIAEPTFTRGKTLLQTGGDFFNTRDQCARWLVDERLGRLCRHTFQKKASP